MKKHKTSLLIAPIILVVLPLLLLFAYLIDHSTTAYSAFSKSNESKIFIIDAGHGGIDGGAVSISGAYESQINLQIAIRLNDLMHFLGYRTKMIRTEDISVYTTGETISAKKISDLKERVRIINSTPNSILISIHQNYFQDDRYHGAQVFYSENSESFAKRIQSHFITTINKGSNRKIKKANNVYLMENIHCVGVLVECGFLSNRTEEINLLDAAYQKKICCIIASAASCYVNDSTVA